MDQPEQLGLFENIVPLIRWWILILPIKIARNWF